MNAVAELAIQREAVAKVVMQPLCLASPIFQKQQLTKEAKHVAEQNRVLLESYRVTNLVYRKSRVM